MIISIVSALAGSYFVIGSIGLPEHFCTALKIVIRGITLSDEVGRFKRGIFKCVIGKLTAVAFKSVKQTVTICIIFKKIEDAIAIHVVCNSWVST